MRRDPFVGFGDDTNSNIKFQLVHDRGKLGDWSGGPRMIQHKVALSSATKTQTWGRDPWQATFLLLFDRIADYELLDAVQGQRATLRILADVTKTAGGTVSVLLGTRYLTLPDTLLLKLDDEVVYLRGRYCRAKATFQRAATGDSYVGFSSTGEDDE